MLPGGGGTSHQHIITATRPHGLLFFFKVQGNVDAGEQYSTGHFFEMVLTLECLVLHTGCALGRAPTSAIHHPPDLAEELRLYSPFFNFAVLRLMKHGGNGLWAGTNGTGDPALLFPSSTFV